jgi:hypothetical protein
MLKDTGAGHTLATAMPGLPLNRRPSRVMLKMEAPETVSRSNLMAIMGADCLLVLANFSSMRGAVEMTAETTRPNLLSASDLMTTGQL